MALSVQETAQLQALLANMHSADPSLNKKNRLQANGLPLDPITGAPDPLDLKKAAAALQVFERNNVPSADKNAQAQAAVVALISSKNMSIIDLEATRANATTPADIALIQQSALQFIIGFNTSHDVKQMMENCPFLKGDIVIKQELVTHFQDNIAPILGLNEINDAMDIATSVIMRDRDLSIIIQQEVLNRIATATTATVADIMNKEYIMSSHAVQDAIRDRACDLVDAAPNAVELTAINTAIIKNASDRLLRLNNHQLAHKILDTHRKFEEDTLGKENLLKLSQIVPNSQEIQHKTALSFTPEHKVKSTELSPEQKAALRKKAGY